MHTEVSSKEEESQLRETNVMGVKNPRALRRAIFYLNGRNFCLRGWSRTSKLQSDYFYARPFPTVPTDPDKSWFTLVPIRKNTLSSLL